LDKIFRFARFEVDRERYQLRCGSRTIKLERIPLELLFLLLEHIGKLVSREQIVAELWRNDSFLDTERSINTAVRKIRRALEDDAHHPKFIETVVGKGYRFIAPLIPQNPVQTPQFGVQMAPPEGTNHEGTEIRLRGFAVETVGGTSVVTCDVMVGSVPLGRLPLSQLDLPSNWTLPLNPEDQLLLELHGVRINLTAVAAQALHTFSLSILQRRLRTDLVPTLPLDDKSGAPTSEQ
jgi:DNA-binding winged helix-turn-helix (wHTH) protein